MTPAPDLGDILRRSIHKAAEMFPEFYAGGDIGPIAGAGNVVLYPVGEGGHIAHEQQHLGVAAQVILNAHVHTILSLISISASWRLAVLYQLTDYQAVTVQF